MNRALLLRIAGALAPVLIVAWVVRNTEWVEVDEPAPAGAALLHDPHYALRKLAAATGTPLEIRSALEPLPPPGATLVLASMNWQLFPEAGARLKAWVEAGGHLVIVGPGTFGAEMPAWIPLTFRPPRTPRAGAPALGAQASRPAGAGASAAVPGASASASASAGTDADEARPPSAPLQATPRRLPPGLAPASAGYRDCKAIVERSGMPPAFDAGRRYITCLYPVTWVRALNATPSWALDSERGPIAVRLPFGRGEITGTSIQLPIENRARFIHDSLALTDGDNALVFAAIVDLPAHRPLWLVEDEARDPLPLWLWRHARAPLLLALAAIALGLWRLMVRFGPREAALAQARRSMGEQVRGTGEFIARRDPQALHAAALRAFDAAAAARIAGWRELDEDTRLDALARSIPLDRPALRAALHPGPASTPAQWLAAIAAIEAARRALLPAARTHA